MPQKPFDLRVLRRFSQLLFLIIFLVLFRLTDYWGKDEIGYAVNIIFRIDPLLLLSTFLSEKKITYLLLPALIVVFITIFLGRVFCGWICPLGTLLDIFNRLFAKNYPTISVKNLKYYILATIIITSLFNLQLAGILDPFSILVRGLTVFFDPLFYYIGIELLTLDRYTPNVLDTVLNSLFPHRKMVFVYVFPSVLLLVIIFYLEFIDRRFWCRNLCPLGALLALMSRFSLFRRFPQVTCKDCEGCARFCRMSAFNREEKGLFQVDECILCLDCIYDCRNQRAVFKFHRSLSNSRIDISRRTFLGVVLGGATLGISERLRHKTIEVLRPPGALAEGDFLSLCVRCGECMKVCVGNALHPDLFNGGIGSIFSPILIPRAGYCEYNCTLCGQVCPTGAIRRLTLEEKRKFVIGKAYFDRNRCLPYLGTPCIVCEEHCPTHDKAIKYEMREVVQDDGKVRRIKVPYVVEELCIGCGICENKCPLPVSAVKVIPAKRDDGDDFIML